jgi:hypothetical protein
MKSYFVKKSIFLPVFSAIFTLFSCTARIDGNITANGSAVMTINMSLGQRMTALIKSMSAVGGQAAAGGQENIQILDGQAISKSMSGAPGIDSVSLKNTSQTAVDGQVKISKMNLFLNEVKGKEFINFEQGSTGGKCVFSVNIDNSQVILGHLSKDVSDYLNALMAPAATGEKMTKTEYLEIVASFYNKGISDEIAASRVRVSIDFPGAVTSAKGATFSGKKAVFDIPLLDLLVLETPLVYEVNWKN